VTNHKIGSTGNTALLPNGVDEDLSMYLSGEGQTEVTAGGKNYRGRNTHP
jgi:hypothetical protein